MNAARAAATNGAMPSIDTRAHLILWVLWAVSGCDAAPPTADSGARSDSGPRADAATGDTGLAVDAGRGIDGGPEADGGVAPTVRCVNGTGPLLIITRDDLLRTGSSAVARLPIQITGAATGLQILSVDETLDGAPVRSWDVATLRAPSGFDGTVTPVPGDPSPTTLFTAVTDAESVELAQCDLPPWSRVDGELAVRLRTNETGELTVRCALAVGFGGRGPEPLDFACARGVPGWLGERPSLSGITSPALIRLMDSPVHAHNSGTTLADGFVATGATLRNTTATFAGETACAPPTEWTATAGTHLLWRGASGADVWSGPVAPGAEERAGWLWQEPGAIPAGFCYPGRLGPPTECLRPTISLTLRGTSSVGAWEWESDLFDCLLP